MMKRQTPHRRSRSRAPAAGQQLELVLPETPQPGRAGRPCNRELLGWCLDRIQRQITEVLEERRREACRREAEWLAAVTAQRARLPWAPQPRATRHATTR